MSESDRTATNLTEAPVAACYVDDEGAVVVGPRYVLDVLGERAEDDERRPRVPEPWATRRFGEVARRLGVDDPSRGLYVARTSALTHGVWSRPDRTSASDSDTAPVGAGVFDGTRFAPATVSGADEVLMSSVLVATALVDAVGSVETAILRVGERCAAILASVGIPGAGAPVTREDGDARALDGAGPFDGAGSFDGAGTRDGARAFDGAGAHDGFATPGRPGGTHDEGVRADVGAAVPGSDADVLGDLVSVRNRVVTTVAPLASGDEVDGDALAALDELVAPLERTIAALRRFAQHAVDEIAARPTAHERARAFEETATTAGDAAHVALLAEDVLFLCLGARLARADASSDAVVAARMALRAADRADRQYVLAARGAVASLARGASWDAVRAGATPRLARAIGGFRDDLDAFAEARGASNAGWLRDEDPTVATAYAESGRFLRALSGAVTTFGARAREAGASGIEFLEREIARGAAQVRERRAKRVQDGDDGSATDTSTRDGTAPDGDDRHGDSAHG